MSRSLPSSSLFGQPGVVQDATSQPVMLNAVKHLAFRPLAIAFQIDPSPSPRHPVAPRATPSADRLD
ncbi:MAG: hypothetical protein FJY67_11990 [Calditrichaeota bacterium]|nr:hypothetical protein [Calditrichota bacterium]